MAEVQAPYNMPNEHGILRVPNEHGTGIRTHRTGQEIHQNTQIDVPPKFHDWLIWWDLENLVLLPHEIADAELFFNTLYKLMGVIKAGNEDETLAYVESLRTVAKRFNKIVAKYEIDSANHG